MHQQITSLLKNEEEEKERRGEGRKGRMEVRK
jgi:hypothetical protein